MTLLLKAATILDSSQPSLHGKKRDILIQNGRIAKIASRIPAKNGVREIKKKNLHVSRGWFDSGVGFGEPGYEERETLSNGLHVAACSGFTAVVLHPNTHPIPDTSGDITFFRERAKDSLTRLYPMGALSLGAEGQELAELFDMKGAGAVAFSDFKHPLDNPNLLKLALLYCQSFGGLVCSFPLDGSLGQGGQLNEGVVSIRLGLRGFPNLSESLRIGRDLDILEYTGGKLHIPTISTETSVNQIAAAKKRGLDVSCSVAIHNLFYTEADPEPFDTNFKILPPLRTEKDRRALLRGVQEGVIDFVSSDHAPLDVEEKRLEFDRAAFGSLGLEAAFGVVNKLFGTELAVEILSRGRQRFGIQEPGLREGEPADLTLFDPEATYTEQRDSLLSTAANSMYEGVELKGKAYGVIVGAETNL